MALVIQKCAPAIKYLKLFEILYQDMQKEPSQHTYIRRQFNSSFFLPMKRAFKISLKFKTLT
jgi:hypothetical protein